MLETGLNTTTFGKTVLAGCFINDLGTVLALGLIFAPFTMKTLIFVGVSILVFILLPYVTPRFFKKYGGRPSEMEAKFLLLCLFGMGGLASWAESEVVLPDYLIGMVLAGTVGKDHFLIRRLRTLTFGSISALFGLSHKIIDTAQYSFLIATVVGSAVVPTLIANAFHLPRHLLSAAEEPVQPETVHATVKAGDKLVSTAEGDLS
jgi:Kef-type K+ transport system membrane component KefB